MIIILFLLLFCHLLVYDYYSPRLPRPAKYKLQGIGGVAFGLLDGVDVAVRRFELSVTEAGGNVLYVRAV